MHYRISAKINQSDEGIAQVWYAGRNVGGPHFETDFRHSKVLRYHYFENAEADQAFLTGLPELCRDVEIVAFDENEQILNDAEVTSNAATIELEDLPALDILKNVQEILTQMVTPGMHAQSDQEIAHEQVRTALNLVLRVISVLKKEEKRH